MLYNAEVYTFSLSCSIPLYEHNGSMALICIYLTFNELMYVFMCLSALWSPFLSSVDLNYLYIFSSGWSEF